MDNQYPAFMLIIEDGKQPTVELEFLNQGAQVRAKIFSSAKEATQWAAERYSLWSIVAFTLEPYTYAGGAETKKLMADSLVDVPFEILQ